MLNASAITKLMRDGDVHWSGELRGDALLLRLGSPLQVLAPAAGTVDLSSQASIDQLYEPPRHEWDNFELSPGQMVLCHVDQPLRLGPGHAGAIGTLSHLARVGLATHITSPWVLPGWNGQITLELLNLGPACLRIHRGMPTARLVLFTMNGTITHTHSHPFYGSSAHLGSRYADEYPAHEYRR
jgi:deoxycytidine triphosphate deaminase